MTDRRPLREPSPPPAEGLCAIERIELRSAASAFAAIPPEEARKHRMEAIAVGSAMVFVAARSRSVHVNRALGLGLEEPATLVQVDGVLEAFAARGVRRFSIPVAPWAAPPHVTGWLRSRRLDGGASGGKLWRDAGNPARRRPPTSASRRSAPGARARGGRCCRPSGRSSARGSGR